MKFQEKNKGKRSSSGKARFDLSDPAVEEHIKDRMFAHDIDDPIEVIRKDMILKFFSSNPHTTFYLHVVWYSRWGNILMEKEYRLKFKAKGMVGIFPSLFLVGEEQFVSEGCYKGAVFLCKRDDGNAENFGVCTCTSVSSKKKDRDSKGCHLNYMLQSRCTLVFEFGRPFDEGSKNYNPDMPFEVINRCWDFTEHINAGHAPRLENTHLPNCPISFTITVLRGSSLMASDGHDSLSDPFVSVEYDGKSRKTGCSHDTLNPEWKEDNELTFKIKHPERFRAMIWCNDKDKIRNDFIGEAEINLAIMNPLRESKLEVPLKHDKASAGWLTIKVRFERNPDDKQG